MEADPPFSAKRRHAVGWVAACAATAGAPAVAAGRDAAACRPLRMPLSPAGALVQLREEHLDGVLPDLVELLSRRLGCPVDARLTPRARQVKMFFETHEADIFWPAVRHPRRDLAGRFCSFFKGVVHLVTRADTGAPTIDTAGLLARREWLGAMVSGYTFGPVYDDLVRALSLQHRLTMVRDPSTALRMVAAGRVQFTVLNPLTAYGESLEADVGQYNRFALNPLGGLPLYEGGAYISRHSMPATAQDRVLAVLESMVAEGHILRAMRRFYPAPVLRQEFGADTPTTG